MFLVEPAGGEFGDLAIVLDVLLVVRRIEDDQPGTAWLDLGLLLEVAEIAVQQLDVRQLHRGHLLDPLDPRFSHGLADHRVEAGTSRYPRMVFWRNL